MCAKDAAMCAKVAAMCAKDAAMCANLPQSRAQDSVPRFRHGSGRPSPYSSSSRTLANNVRARTLSVKSCRA